MSESAGETDGGAVKEIAKTGNQVLGTFKTSMGLFWFLLVAGFMGLVITVALFPAVAPAVLGSLLLFALGSSGLIVHGVGAWRERRRESAALKADQAKRAQALLRLLRAADAETIDLLRRADASHEFYEAPNPIEAMKLEKLCRDGFLQAEDHPQPGRGPSRLYSVLPHARDALLVLRGEQARRVIGEPTDDPPRMLLATPAARDAPQPASMTSSAPGVEVPTEASRQQPGSQQPSATPSDYQPKGIGLLFRLTLGANGTPIQKFGYYRTLVGAMLGMRAADSDSVDKLRLIEAMFREKRPPPDIEAALDELRIDLANKLVRSLAQYVGHTPPPSKDYGEFGMSLVKGSGWVVFRGLRSAVTESDPEHVLVWNTTEVPVSFAVAGTHSPFPPGLRLITTQGMDLFKEHGVFVGHLENGDLVAFEEGLLQIPADLLKQAILHTAKERAIRQDAGQVALRWIAEHDTRPEVRDALDKAMWTKPDADPRILVWNRRDGISGIGGHRFYPGLNALTPPEWEAIAREFQSKTQAMSGSVEILGRDPAALDPIVLVEAIRHTAAERPGLPRSALGLAAFRWLLERETRPLVRKALHQVLRAH